MKPLYVVKRVLRRQIPPWLFFKLMEHTGKSNRAERCPDEAFDELCCHLRRLDIGIVDKDVLEFGSGRAARLALRLLNAGASRVMLVDPHAAPYAPRQRMFLDLDSAQLGLDLDRALSCIDTYHSDFLDTSPPSQEATADLIISKSALEHVQDPLAVFEKCWDWLRPGGVMSHVIDLRDHLFDTPFEMLTYSDRTWERWLDPTGGFHLNRWRAPNYLRAMREVGFVEIQYTALEEDRAELQRILPRLHEKFVGVDVDMLSITRMHVYGRKPD